MIYFFIVLLWFPLCGLAQSIHHDQGTEYSTPQCLPACAVSFISEELIPSCP